MSAMRMRRTCGVVSSTGWGLGSETIGFLPSLPQKYMRLMTSGQSTSFITTPVTDTSSTLPPRPRRDLMRMPRSVPSNTQPEIATRRMLPLISLPSTTPPWPCTIVQPVTVMFSQGMAWSASSVPALMAMQSSPTSMWQALMRTLRQLSGSMPSVLGESDGFTTVRPWIVTFSQHSGCTVQAGLFVTLKPSISTRLQFSKQMKHGRAAFISPARNAVHHLRPQPSSVPQPVSAMFSSPLA